MMKLPLSAYLCVLWCELIWWSYPCQLICVSCDVSWYYDEATPVSLFVHLMMWADIMMKLPLSTYLCILWCELIWWSYPLSAYLCILRWELIWWWSYTCQPICVSCRVGNLFFSFSSFAHVTLLKKVMGVNRSCCSCKCHQEKFALYERVICSF